MRPFLSKMVPGSAHSKYTDYVIQDPIVAFTDLIHVMDHPNRFFKRVAPHWDRHQLEIGFINL